MEDRHSCLSPRGGGNQTGRSAYPPWTEGSSGMSVTFGTRRHLPHLQYPGRRYFVTFATAHREPLEPAARDIVMDRCLFEHEQTCCLYCVVIMPDHAHLIITPYDAWTLPRILRRVKGVSARLINASSNRQGPVWQSESFDRMLRSEDDLLEKAEYTCLNPVRAGLVTDVERYRWKWRLWVEGRT